MKRRIIPLLTAMLILAACSTALASGDHTNWAYGFDAQCTSTTEYTHDTESYKKLSSEQLIDCRANVLNISNCNTFSVHMRPYNRTDGVYVGGRWQIPNTGTYLPAALSGLVFGKYYAMGGRGNTDYYSQCNLRYVRVEGQFRVH